MALFQELASSQCKNRKARQSKGKRVEFVHADPEGILIGNKTLRECLGEREQHDVFLTRDFLQEQDWSEFVKGYKGGGRPPYDPAAMASLILFGIMQGRSSLRDLEKTAACDLRCWWLSGGIAPDHSQIGQFLQRHEKLISEEFFESLTAGVLKKTGSSGRELAGDGTTIQAASANFRNIKAEAAREAAQEARRRAAQKPEDGKQQAQAELAEAVAEAAEERTRKAKAKGRRNHSEVRVNSQEPEACVQPLKNKKLGASYKPTVLANEKRVITAQTVHPVSETEELEQLLEQSERTSGSPPEKLLGDGAWNGSQTLGECSRKGVRMISPPAKEKEEKVLPKRAFCYNKLKDSYLCPGGHELVRIGPVTSRGRTTVAYGRAPCRQCPLRPVCAPKSPRRIHRHGAEEYKEHLRRYLQTPEGKREYGKRMAWVEPVFSDLACIQGLRRFRRRGLKKVKLEFALHAAAHNLRRLVALTRGAGASGQGGDPSFLAFLGRFWGRLAAMARPWPQGFAAAPLT
jgi:transposase